MTSSAIGPVRLRVAPSPTGDPHVGTAYVSLFDLAFVRQQGGQFVLRIEDTDRARFREDSEQQIFDTLSWLGLHWDEGPDIGGPFAPYRQSERLDTYAPYVDRLLADGNAYYCWCTTERLAQMREAQQKAKQPPGYDRMCLGKTREERAQLPGFSPDPVVRMLIPADVETRFTDLIRGEVNAPHPDDQVILKADGFPTYHLAVVVDDHEMGITHIVRGEEWISSTPKHILLYQWLGLTPPQFAHMPLLRNDDRSKISKRKNPAARLTWFREQGYLPEALVNFLGLMGYSMPDEREVFSFAEMSAEFDWSRVNVVGPIFNLDKLNWLNGHYIRALSVDDLADRILDQLVRSGALTAEPTDRQREFVRSATPLVQERMQLLSEAPDLIGFLLVSDDDLVVADDARAALAPDAGATLAAAQTALQELTDWTTAAIEATLRAALVDGLGLKARLAFTPLRVAVTGRRISPPLFESMELLGRQSTLSRIASLAAELRLAKLDELPADAGADLVIGNLRIVLKDQLAGLMAWALLDPKSAGVLAKSAVVFENQQRALADARSFLRHLDDCRFTTKRASGGTWLWEAWLQDQEVAASNEAYPTEQDARFAMHWLRNTIQHANDVT